MGLPEAAIAGGGALPVRRIFCVGQNYRAHAIEMGGDPAREAPFFFAKPADALAADGASIPYPPMTAQLEHEVELVVALGAGGRDIPAEAAPALILGFGVGIDLTRRDLQAAAKKAGRPWDMAKGFDFSAPLGALLPAAQVDGMPRGAIGLAVNGAWRQSADLAEMIWRVPEIIAELSRFVALARGDLIFTGTPAGVGPLVPGDRVLARVEGLPELRIAVAAALSAGAAPGVEAAAPL